MTHGTTGPYSINKIIIYTKPDILINFLEHNELQLLHPLLGLIRRTEHVKIRNYIDNIVCNYDDRDFLMHFRLSREVTYELINQFRVSEIFTSIQGKCTYIIN